MAPPLGVYEFGHYLFPNVTIYDWVISKIPSRVSLETLIFGQNYSAQSFHIEAHDLPNMGVSLLGSYLLTKYGPHGGPHGHYDKGTIIIYKVTTIFSS